MICNISKITESVFGGFKFTAKFNRMRKPQVFVIYPPNGKFETVKIQSDTRIGHINMETGEVKLTPPVSSGAYFPHLHMSQLKNDWHSSQLSPESLDELKEFIKK